MFQHTSPPSQRRGRFRASPEARPGVLLELTCEGRLFRDRLNNDNFFFLVAATRGDNANKAQDCKQFDALGHRFLLSSNLPGRYLPGTFEVKGTWEPLAPTLKQLIDK